jgi:hypothetical protein
MCVTKNAHTAPKHPHQPHSFSQYSITGHDLKSLLINLASLLLILLPIAAYLDTERIKIYAGIVAASMVLAYVASPVGWMRPHPYSDMPENRGAGARKVD